MLADSELGEGIRGRIKDRLIKGMIPQGRYADPQDVANVALFLASDLSGYVNGESILVDGGLTNTA